MEPRSNRLVADEVSRVNPISQDQLQTLRRMPRTCGHPRVNDIGPLRLLPKVAGELTGSSVDSGLMLPG